MSIVVEWNEHLQVCKEKMQLAQLWETRLANLREKLTEQYHTVDQCRLRLQGEQQDVDQLREPSLSRFMMNLFGRLEDKLREEEREAAEAKLKYDAANSALIDMELEQTELIAKLADIGQPDREYEWLLAEKEAWIRDHDTSTTARLEELSEEIALREAIRKEIREAAGAGAAVSAALGNAEDRLDSAGSWGKYDLIGGGLISTAIKHGHIDEARGYIHEAQNSLRRFNKELQDLKWNGVDNSAQIGGFATFADFFFDGFIADWIVQGKIRDSLGSVQSQRAEVERLISKLKKDQSEQERLIDEFRNEFRRIVEQLQ